MQPANARLDVDKDFCKENPCYYVEQYWSLGDHCILETNHDEEGLNLSDDFKPSLVAPQKIIK